MLSWKSYLLGLCCGLLAAGLLLLANGRWEGTAVTLLPPGTPPGVRISVQGAVRAPGVYHLPSGSILQDALAQAGGALPDADLARLALAAPVQDGQDIRVPTRPPAVTAAPPPSGAPDIPAGGRINLNTATLAQLDSLPGIGPAIAQRIIDYREQHGPFQSVDELLRVKGIGPALLAKIRDLVEAP